MVQVRPRAPFGLLTEPLSESGGPRATPTPNLLIRSQMLYPIELWDLWQIFAQKETGAKAGIEQRETLQTYFADDTLTLSWPESRDARFSRLFHPTSVVFYQVGLSPI